MSDKQDVSISCRCGKVQGVICRLHPETCNHVVCLCDDCQAYGRFLGGADLLDANGGTEIVQVAHNQVALNEGREQVACVRLYPTGMHRWYARCCNTPLANTLGPKSLFAGVISVCLKAPLDGSPLVDAIGPIRERVQGKFGKGDLPSGTRQTVSPSMLLFVLRRVLSWWVGGARTPSTFFIDGGPFVVPKVLSADERRALG